MFLQQNDNVVAAFPLQALPRFMGTSQQSDSLTAVWPSGLLQLVGHTPGYDGRAVRASRVTVWPLYSMPGSSTPGKCH